MKRKICIILSTLLLSAFLWAQDPSKSFPYYYYDKSERSFSDYEYHLTGRNKLIEEDDEHTIKMYKDNDTYYIWVKYKMLSAASEGDIKHTLKVFKDVAANLDQKLDRKQGEDVDICLIFTKHNNELICSAYYSENY
jgi:hypothetical protein